MKFILLFSLFSFSLAAAEPQIFFDCSFKSDIHIGKVYVGPMNADGTCNVDGVRMEKFYCNDSGCFWDGDVSDRGECGRFVNPMETFVIFAQANHNSPPFLMFRVLLQEDGTYLGTNVMGERAQDLKMSCVKYLKQL